MSAKAPLLLELREVLDESEPYCVALMCDNESELVSWVELLFTLVVAVGSQNMDADLAPGYDSDSMGSVIDHCRMLRLGMLVIWVS